MAGFFKFDVTDLESLEYVDSEAEDGVVVASAIVTQAFGGLGAGLQWTRITSRWSYLASDG